MSEPALHDDPPVALELRVLDGPQRGARTPLPAGIDWCLHAGPAASHDAVQAAVALLAPEPAQLRMRREAGQIRLQLTEGLAELGGKPIARDVHVAWRSGQPLKLGGHTLAFGPAHLDAWPVPQPTVATPQEPVSAAPLAPAPGAERRWPLLLAGAGVMLVASSAALGLLAELIPVHAASAPTAPPPPARVAATALDLEAAVADVFRLHGIQARVANVGKGAAIEVHTTEVDANRLARAEAAVRRDLPGVQALKVVNSAPARAAARPALEDNPGKRITGVVADEELPYLVTADGSRYFQGAWLPSGHRVVSIADRRVTVELDGVSTELAL